ncbi:MAG: YjgP/YjgQ family permease [Gemmatimonadales bacterium]|nr:YjgP/YjgQ family permease [Gemmatimonadales bacterium]MYG49840.1 YjgP/YjgQ family permease [Gemmatimonadales bacterium]MYK03212.1 YjgP/YjgQ family permease [Candidatus Palauibacter ramosifaciens]
MKLLDRYVLSQFLRIFAACALGVPFLFMVIDIADNLDRFLDQGSTWSQIVLHYLYGFPYHSLLGFPIAALLGSVFTVASMSRHFEVAAVKAGGVSFYRLALPILCGATLLSFVALGLTELVAVTTRESAEVLEQEEARSQTIRNSFVYRGDEGLVYKARLLDAREGRMDDVQIERRGSGPDFPTIHITANVARYDSASSRWVLERGWMREFRGPEEETAYEFGELFVRQLDETPEELQARPKEPDEMRYAELGRLIEAVERSGGTTNGLRTSRAQRIAFPFTCLVIAVFGIPLAQSNKRGGAPTSIGIALGTTILFLTLIRIAEAMGAGGALLPAAAAWLPNVIFFGAGLLLFAKLRT